MSRVYLSNDPKDYALRVLRDLAICAPPVREDSILNYFGLKVRTLDLEHLPERLIPVRDLFRINGIESFLVREGESGTIFVLSGLGAQRRRMAIFHEVAHFDLPWHSGYAFICDGRQWSRHQPQIEREAFRYAVELLMPTDSTKELVHTKPFQVRQIQQYAKKCGASFESAAIRFVRLTNSRCAVIHIVPNTRPGLAESTHRVRYAIGSRRFAKDLRAQLQIRQCGLITDFVNAQGTGVGTISASELGLAHGSWLAHCELKWHGDNQALGLLTIPEDQRNLHSALEIPNESRPIRQSILRKTGRERPVDIRPA